MDQYDHDNFDDVESLPTIREIKKRLRKLGCTKEQVKRHVDQVTESRSPSPKQKRRRPQPKVFDWLI